MKSRNARDIGRWERKPNLASLKMKKPRPQISPRPFCLATSGRLRSYDISLSSRMKFYLRAISYFKEDIGKIVMSLVIITAMTACGLLQVYPFAILTDTIFGG